MGTGNSECPDDVRAAKRINYRIKDKSDLINAGEIEASDVEVDGTDGGTADEDTDATTSTKGSKVARKKKEKPPRPPRATTSIVDPTMHAFLKLEESRMKEESRREKRRDKMFAVGLTAVASMFGGKKTGKKVRQAVMSIFDSSDEDEEKEEQQQKKEERKDDSDGDSDDSSDEEEPLSPIRDDDSPPTKRKKRAQLHQNA